MRIPLLSLTLTTLIALSFSAHAQTSPAIAFSAGEFDVFDENHPAVGVEWRGYNIEDGLHPIVGAQADIDKDVYGYGGFGWNIPVSEKVAVTPSLAVGAYHNGNGLDLGGGLEFRSAIEGSYKLKNDSLVGLSLNHISNGGIHDTNPGAETLAVTWTVPLSHFKK